MTYTAKQIAMIATAKEVAIIREKDASIHLGQTINKLIAFLALNKDNLAGIAFVGLLKADESVIGPSETACDGIQLRDTINDFYSRNISTRLEDMIQPDKDEDENPLAAILAGLRR
jgi:hypothetical protein